MAKDVELDRLKAVQDEAKSVRDDAVLALVIAERERDTAKAANDLAGNDFHKIKHENQPAIDDLYMKQEAAFEARMEASGNAREAYRSGQGGGAKFLSEQARIYGDEERKYVVERRKLEEDVSRARIRFEATKSTFDRVNSSYLSKKKKLEQAESDLEAATAALQLAESEPSVNPNRREELCRKTAQHIMDTWHKVHTTYWADVYEDDDFDIGYKHCFNRRYGKVVTEIGIEDKKNDRELLVITFDESGNEIFAQWR